MLNIEAINERFVGLSKAILKRRNLFLLLMVLVLAFSVYGLKQLKTDTDDSHYFDEGDALLVAKDYMASIFGNDNFWRRIGGDGQCLYPQGAERYPGNGQGAA